MLPGTIQNKDALMRHPRMENEGESVISLNPIKLTSAVLALLCCPALYRVWRLSCLSLNDPALRCSKPPMFPPVPPYASWASTHFSQFLYFQWVLQSLAITNCCVHLSRGPCAILFPRPARVPRGHIYLYTLSPVAAVSGSMSRSAPPHQFVNLSLLSLSCFALTSSSDHFPLSGC